MYKPKFKHKIFLLMCVAVFALGVAALADAYIRPANPTMDYVPQNMGIYDTYYCNFKESDCRSCHGTSTAIRHHGTKKALQGDCLFCHLIIPGVVPPERDCKICHIDGGPIGDFGAPHHRTNLADSNQCTACHDPNLLVETNTVEPPGYEPTNITPTPYACENCHWPSGNAPHKASLVNGNTALFQTEWSFWQSFPKPTTWPDSLPHPQAIEANGPMFSGILFAGGLNLQRPTPWIMPAKPFTPFDGTHHEVDGAVYPKCYNCHGTNPDTDPSWDPTDPYLIRMCENCHDVGTLHAIQEHTTNGIYGGQYRVNNLLKPITANQKCVACHSDSQGTLPPLPSATPVIAYAEPHFGSPGIVASLFHVTPPALGCTFGEYIDGDKVQIGQDPDGAGPQPIAWVDVPLYSWTEDKVQFTVPGWVFNPLPSPAFVRVVKQGVNSNAIWLGIRKHPEISSLAPSRGVWNTVVTVNGVGFFGNREFVDVSKYPSLPSPRYGYSTYVELTASYDRYRATIYSTGGGWNDTTFQFQLKNLLDVNTGNQVPLPDLYEGCWNVTVVTDYFKDDGDAQYNLGLAGLDTGDTLLYREVSDPLCFTVTDTPTIFSVRPQQIPGGNTAMIYGINFGPTKQDSYAIIGVGPKEAEVMGDGLGDEDGICEPAVPGEVCTGDGDGLCEQGTVAGEACTLNTYKVLPVVWSNTKIKFKAPTLGAYPKDAFVQVIVPGAAQRFSNLVRVRIIQP